MNFRHRLRRGVNSTLASLRGRDSVSLTAKKKYHHPWWTTPAWSLSAGWTATVLAGFVNGQAPVYRATIAEQKDLGNPWENNPLTGQPFFSAPIFQQPTQAQAAETVDLPLYFNPAMPLSFRALGFDGDGSFAVPQFFLNKGVANAPQQPSAEDVAAGNTDLSTPAPPPGLRLLRACDCWVHQPRVALTSDVEQNAAGLLTGQASVIQTLGVAFPDPNDRLQILAGTFVADTQSIDPLASDYTEPTFDQILVSTVYLLSPANTPVGSQPDQTWQPFVRHNLFWNLLWAQPVFHAPIIDSDGLTIPPLAAGAATLVISGLNSQIANMTQQATNILQAASLAGTFWTATGGGHDALPLPTSAATPPAGPNRSANLAAATAAAQVAMRTAQLDPDFPYSAQPFDLSLLNA